MDRTIVIAGSAPIPHGHRVEVIERDDDGHRTVIVITDLETRVRYQHGVRTLSGVSSWIGRVLDCTVTTTSAGVSTALLVDPVGQGGAETDVALRGADAAADAAKAEADRWGGADRTPEPEAPRFW
jgi:mRNA-degrading endonuclease toxin of MazEF toxin-antitoxin module